MKPNMANVKMKLTLELFRNELIERESKARAMTYGNSKTMWPSATRKPPLANLLAPTTTADAVSGPGEKAPETDIAIVEMMRLAVSIGYQLQLPCNLYIKMLKLKDLI